jgi:diguanylate cyclase (GGDEF)-like protein
LNPVLGVLNRIGALAQPQQRETSAGAAAPEQSRAEAALALARELLHSVEQFIISTPDLDTARFLQRMRSTASGLHGGVDIATLRLYREWVKNALGTFAGLQKRYVREREDEMWRLLRAMSRAAEVGHSTDHRLAQALRESHGRMRELAALPDIREARLQLEEELQQAQKLVELKARRERERLAALQREVQRLEAALEAVRGQADYDVLTGVFHRGVFDEKLRSVLREGVPFSIAMIDVDNFKTINDSLGHAVGDRVLTIIGNNLLRVSRSTDVPARYGGDEFAFIAGGFNAEQTAQRLAGAVARRHIRMELEEGERVISVLLSTSVGVAAYRPGDTYDSLMHRADQAMISAKKARKGGIRIAL